MACPLGHALVTQVFAEFYEAYWWTPPAGIHESMDYIAWYPSNVGYVMVFAVPFAALLAGARNALLTHRPRVGTVNVPRYPV